MLSVIVLTVMISVVVHGINAVPLRKLYGNSTTFKALFPPASCSRCLGRANGHKRGEKSRAGVAKLILCDELLFHPSAHASRWELRPQ